VSSLSAMASPRWQDAGVLVIGEVESRWGEDLDGVVREFDVGTRKDRSRAKGAALLSHEVERFLGRGVVRTEFPEHRDTSPSTHPGRHQPSDDRPVRPAGLGRDHDTNLGLETDRWCPRCRDVWRRPGPISRGEGAHVSLLTPIRPTSSSTVTSAR
jgi:hypothetical protein